MKGLAIWAHDNCRSTLGFYLELGKAFDVPFNIYIVHQTKHSNREKVGFKTDELSGDARIIFLDGDSRLAVNELQDHAQWNHLFASYQKQDLFNLLIKEAIKNKITYGIMSEAPCNMDASISRRFLKNIYIKFILPRRVGDIIASADFILNYSGYYDTALHGLGWENRKIVSCGYYPPPIPGSTLNKRTEQNWENFTVLLSGLHQWHRSPFVFLKAIDLLNKRGVRIKCYITQEGPLLPKMKQFVLAKHLNNIEFLGFVPMQKLIDLYESCSVYVGAGGAEPWGMRLNDALQCGAPLIVSRGMGGVKLVDEFGCGLAFTKNDYIGLANAIENLARNMQLYLDCANNAYNAALSISPEHKAREVASRIQASFSRWTHGSFI